MNMATRIPEREVFLIVVLVVLSSCPLLSEDTRVHHERTAGDEAFVRGDYAAAEKHYKGAVDLAKQNGPDNSNFILATGDLARLYAAEKRDAEAEALFRQRLSIAERIWINNPQSLFFVYDDLAMFYLLRDRYDDAHPLYLKSLDLRAQAFGVNATQVAQGLELYAALLKAKRHEQEGLEMETRANNSRKKHSIIRFTYVELAAGVGMSTWGQGFGVEGQDSVIKSARPTFAAALPIQCFSRLLGPHCQSSKNGNQNLRSAIGGVNMLAITGFFNKPS
jgi:tetratricopeptide (TPR) repeat protein